MSDAAASLTARGMSADEAERKAERFAAAERALGRIPSKRWFVPGRIEVLGKHTDYAGGPSLVCAAERGICVVSDPRSDSLVRVTDAERQQTIEVRLSPDSAIPAGWGNYVATVARRIARNFPGASRGADVAFASDLPSASGLSSSSALVIAVFTAVADANGLADRDEFKSLGAAPEELAAYLACIENGQSYRELAGDRGVGTFGGSEDHTAILCARAGHVSRYRFCPARLEQQIQLPTEWTFVVASSGVRASKTGAARDLYNHASLAAKAVLEVWNAASRRNDATLDAALQVSHGAKEEIRTALYSAQHHDFTSDELLRRFEHYALETRQVIPAACAALERADGTELGEVVDQSQHAAQKLLGNQVPETIALASSAREVGAIAASAFGAGFGGSVWALAPRSAAAEFLAEWRRRYTTSYPRAAQQAEFFPTGAGPALTRI